MSPGQSADLQILQARPAFWAKVEPTKVARVIDLVPLAAGVEIVDLRLEQRCLARPVGVANNLRRDLANNMI